MSALTLQPCSDGKKNSNRYITAIQQTCPVYSSIIQLIHEMIKNISIITTFQVNSYVRSKLLVTVGTKSLLTWGCFLPYIKTDRNCGNDYFNS